jgi:hypothetical protein
LNGIERRLEVRQTDKAGRGASAADTARPFSRLILYGSAVRPFSEDDDRECSPEPRFFGLPDEKYKDNHSEKEKY